MRSTRWMWLGCVVGSWICGCGDDGSVATGDGTSTGAATSTGEPGTDTGAPTSTSPPTSTSGMTGGDDASSSGAVDPGTTTSSGEPDTTSSGEPDTTTTGDPDTGESSGPPPALCGDGVVQDGEACDDGNADNTDDCPDTCVAAVCGDGFVHADLELCDDGNDDDTDDCPGTCVVAACGDGFVQAGVEACDDANAVDTDDCLATCVAAACGDGVVHEGVEACDDGNDLDTDDCLTACVVAVCGDGVVHEGVEACDDGNDFDGDGCTNACELPACAGGKDCLVVVSNSLGQARLYEGVNFTLIDTYPGLSGPQSVAVGGNGKLYVGQSGVVRTVDLATKATADIGAGLVQGNLYGATVQDDRAYFSGSGMTTIRVLSLAGADMGTIASPNGSNLRSTAFGPQGDLYLSSFGQGPMQRWSPGVIYVGAFAGGGLATAFGVTTRSNADVLVAGQDQAAYYVFGKDGAFKKKVAVACVGQLRNIVADAADTLYVACYENNKVAVFNAADQPIASIDVPTPAGVDVLTALP